MSSRTARVGVIGYGVIGKRVAPQDDMTVAGVSGVALGITPALL